MIIWVLAFEMITSNEYRKINNKLLENGYPTVQDSEILHQLIEIGLKKLDVDNLGRFHIKN